jgi:hypothetical protein
VDEEVIQKLEMIILSSLHFSSIQSNIGGGKSGKVSSFSISYPHGGYRQERREGGKGTLWRERERDDQMQHRWMGWTGIPLLLVVNGFFWGFAQLNRVRFPCGSRYSTLSFGAWKSEKDGRPCGEWMG